MKPHRSACHPPDAPERGAAPAGLALAPIEPTSIEFRELPTPSTGMLNR